MYAMFVVVNVGSYECSKYEEKILKEVVAGDDEMAIHYFEWYRRLACSLGQRLRLYHFASLGAEKRLVAKTGD